MRANLTQLITEHCPDVHDLETLLDKIEALVSPKEDNSLETRRSKFIEEVRPFLEEYGKEMLNEFSRYWLEISSRGKKFRFEKQSTFNVPLRLKNWNKMSRKFSIVGMLNKK